MTPKRNISEGQLGMQSRVSISELGNHHIIATGLLALSSSGCMSRLCGRSRRESHDCSPAQRPDDVQHITLSLQRQDSLTFMMLAGRDWYVVQ